MKKIFSPSVAPTFLHFIVLSIGIFSTGNALASKCKFAVNINKVHKEAAEFVKDSSFGLHLQLTNENFNSQNAQQARSKIFDTVLATPYWSQKLRKPNDFKFFWNWIRFQYWGLIQQQGLLKEDQGFRVNSDNTLGDNYNSILKFPIYPYPVLDEEYRCSSSEKNFYNCSQKIIKINVLLSPALACSQKIDTNSLKFSYLVTKSSSGLAILDIKFKGRNLVADSFNEYDNLINKYGNDKALNYLKFLINKVPIFEPTTKLEHNGSVVFNRVYKLTTPKYPLEY